MNKTLITGRMTRDPELRQTQSGISCCRFTVAVDRPYQKDKEKEADFITCVAWRASAEFITRYFKKGDPIEIEGSLRTGSYQDKNYHDVTHYTTDVLVEKVNFTLSSKSSGNGEHSGSSEASQNTGNYQDSGYSDLSDFEEILSDGDVPF